MTTYEFVAERIYYLFEETYDLEEVDIEDIALLVDEIISESFYSQNLKKNSYGLLLEKADMREEV